MRVPPVIILILVGFSSIHQPFWGTPMATETSTCEKHGKRKSMPRDLQT